MTPGSVEAKAPDRVMQVGGTTIKIFAPAPASEAERKVRHDAIVRAVARCIESQQSRS